MWGDWKVVIYVLLHGNQMIDFNKYFSQSGQFKAAIDETHGGGGHNIHQDHFRAHIALVTKQNCYSLAGMFYIHRLFTGYCTFGFPFNCSFIQKNSLNGRK